MSCAVWVAGTENIHFLYGSSVAITEELAFFDFLSSKTYYLRNKIKQQRNNKII